jgi:hypothetical protein
VSIVRFDCDAFEKSRRKLRITISKVTSISRSARLNAASICAQRLVASGFFFYWCYGKILAHFAPKAGSLADQYDRAVRMLALGNTVPFVGPLTIDSEIKKFLFCPTNICPTPIIPPDGYQLAVLSQKSSSQSSSSFSSASRCAIISKSSEAI